MPSWVGDASKLLRNTEGYGFLQGVWGSSPRTFLDSSAASSALHCIFGSVYPNTHTPTPLQKFSSDSPSFAHTAYPPKTHSRLSNPMQPPMTDFEDNTAKIRVELNQIDQAGFVWGTCMVLKSAYNLLMEDHRAPPSAREKHLPKRLDIHVSNPFCRN